MIYINDWCLNDYVDTVDEKLFFHGESPEIMYEDVTIPGRSGKLHLDLHRFEERTIEISCWMRSDFRNRYRVLLNKLNALKGVVTLRCTPAPEMWGEGYYNTVFKGKISAPTMGSYLKNGSFTLKFNADPRYWLDTGTFPTQPAIWLSPYQKESYTVWKTPNFTYNTGNIFRIGWSGSSTEDTEAVAYFRYPSSKANLNIMLMPGAIEAWQNGEFFDISSSLADGDVFYLELEKKTGVLWTIQTDMVTGTLQTFVTEGSVYFTNPTPFNAKPLFVINVKNDDYSGGATYFTQFAVNGIMVRVKRTYATEHSGRPLYIDCEIQDCWYIDTNGVKQNANSYVVMWDIAKGAETTDFPELTTGRNLTNADYGSTVYYYPTSAWQMYPRWYLI